jgi:hypothetical protein
LAFAEALAAGSTQNDAASAAHVSVRTARRWAHRPEIVAAVRARQVASVAQARGVLAAGAARAARSLVDMSDGKAEADAPRVTAARAVVDGANRLIDLADLEARLADLEARLPTGAR